MQDRQRRDLPGQRISWWKSFGPSIKGCPVLSAAKCPSSDAGTDLSGKKVQLQGWLNDLVQISHEVDILGTPGSHYILLDPDTATTATWPPNYYLGLLRIKHDATTFQTIWEGTLRIHAFPTPGI
ncbi:hypothetical protein V7x_54930 [Crateriforma conspicua]|uniref:Uncharacterized protein n=1 Tax=Crateriforma conspicua TaxID=2527996 RepID=A0A5C6FD78_9PLAN|nr:hypothetical protein [Crateriforma conspicua]TWU59718.1 hypothetical protein V7x_54930 [Crateriforma conspicua]